MAFESGVRGRQLLYSLVEMLVRYMRLECKVGSQYFEMIILLSISLFVDMK